MPTPNFNIPQTFIWSFVKPSIKICLDKIAITVKDDTYYR